ncbi:MAG: alpha-galactosidase, partial [Thermoleophilaceae bacterium]|nr:alpha-galactosidase [Thermoleophilaceae bacterium]
CSKRSGPRPRLLGALTGAAIAAGALALMPAPAAALDNGLARTPPMGWNSWYTARCDVTEEDVLRNAHGLVDSGMAALGYDYVNVDGCWEALERDQNGELAANPQTFPSGMAALGRAIHAMGLRFGIYTSAGFTICVHPQPGSWDHFKKDMRTFARWKVDYVKVDWCSPPHGSDPRKVYPRVARAAARSGRTMLVTVSTPGFKKPWRWAGRYGNSWRISADADGTWGGVTRSLDADAPLSSYAEPGSWNDPDMLQVGSRVLSADEERAHFSLWGMLAAPLLEGYDIPSLPFDSLAVLKNTDVIRVDQDARGVQGRRIRKRNGVEVWVKPLVNGAVAVAVLNRSGRARSVKVRLSKVPGLPSSADGYVAKELWRKERLVLAADAALRAFVPKHGVAMWRVRRAP